MQAEQTYNENGHKRAYLSVGEIVRFVCWTPFMGSGPLYYQYLWLRLLFGLLFLALCMALPPFLHIRRVGVALLVLLTGFSGFNGYGRSFTTLFIAIINARIFHFWAVRSFVCVSAPRCYLQLALNVK